MNYVKPPCGTQQGKSCRQRLGQEQGDGCTLKLHTEPYADP